MQQTILLSPWGDYPRFRPFHTPGSGLAASPQQYQASRLTERFWDVLGRVMSCFVFLLWSFPFAPPMAVTLMRGDERAALGFSREHRKAGDCVGLRRLFSIGESNLGLIWQRNSLIRREHRIAGNCVILKRLL